MHDNSIIMEANGHKLRKVETRLGSLIIVGFTGKSFSKLSQAITFANENPPSRIVGKEGARDGM